MYPRIFWLTDFSAQAVACAPSVTSLARLLNVQVVLLHALSGLDGLRDPAWGDLESQAESLRAAGLTVTVRLEMASPAELIPQLGEGLLVVGRTGKSGLDRLLLGSTTSRILRLAKNPVLVVGGKAFDALGAVLCAVDPDAPEAAPIRHALGLARRAGARLCFLAVFPFTENIDAGSAVARVRDVVEAAAPDEALDAVEVTFEAGYAPSPEDGITEVARDYDLVIMGGGTQGRLAAGLFGSVSDQVKTHGPVPVLVARARE